MSVKWIYNSSEVDGNCSPKAAGSMLAAMEEIYLEAIVHKDLSKKQESKHLSGLFRCDGLGGMIERKAECSLTMVFPFVAVFLDWGIGILGRTMLMDVHTLYSVLLHKVYVGLERLTWTEVFQEALNIERTQFQKTLVNTTDKHCGTGIFTLKFHKIRLAC